MKKKIIILIGLIFCFTGPVFGLDWTAFDLKLISHTKNEMILQDMSANQLIVVLQSGVITENIVRKIIKVKNEVFNWDLMKIKRFKAIINNNKMMYIVVPSELQYNGLSLLEFLPGGIVLYDEQYLYYDFRMKKNSYSMKIKGAFVSRIDLLMKMKAAADDPRSFARKTDYLARLERVDKVLEKLIIKNAELQKRLDNTAYAMLYLRNKGFLRGPKKVKADLIDRIVEMKRKDNKLKAGDIYKILDKNGRDISKKIVKLVLILFYNDFSN